MSGGGLGVFTFPGAMKQAESTVKPSGVPVLAANLPTRGKNTVFLYRELLHFYRPCMYGLFVPSTGGDEVIAQLGNMGYVVQFNAHPWLVRKSTVRSPYPTIVISSPFARPRGLLHSR